MTLAEFVSAVTLLVDLIGLTAFCFALATQRFDSYPTPAKIALAIMTLGLLGQIGKQAMIYQNGFHAVETQLPYWLAKDWGIALFAVTLVGGGRCAVMFRRALLCRASRKPPPPANDNHEK